MGRKEEDASWLVRCDLDVHLKHPNWVRHGGVHVTTCCGVAIRGTSYFMMRGMKQNIKEKRKAKLHLRSSCSAI